MHIATTMLSLLFAFLLFATPSYSGEYIVNDVNARYAVAAFNGAAFPFAIDKCQPTTMVTRDSHKFTCISETEAQRTTYSDSSCTRELETTYFYKDTSTGAINSSDSADPGYGELYDFNCDEDAIDAYAKVRYTAGDCDTIDNFAVSAYVSLSVCTQVASRETTISVGCQADPQPKFELQYFEYGSNCSEIDYMFQSNSTDQCEWILTSETRYATITVYGYIEECCTPNCTVFDTATDDDDTTNDDDDDDDAAQKTGARIGLTSLGAILFGVLGVMYV